MPRKQSLDFARRLPDVRWGLLPILLVPVVVSFWPQTTHLATEAEPVEINNNEADYYLRGAVMSSLGEDGRLLYQFRANEVLHYPDETAQATEIEMDYLGSEGTWNIRAPLGTTPSSGNELQLSGGVLIKGQKSQKHPHITISMDNARLLSDTRQLDTDAAVRMDDSGRKVRAVGMTMDIDKDVVKLKNKVRVTHAP